MMDHDRQGRFERALRVSDIMPPFGSYAPHGDDGGARSPLTDPSQTRQEGHDASSRRAGSAARAGKTTQDSERSSDYASDVPQYNLAENILAEQRRMAGRRRRGPGQTPAPRALVEQACSGAGGDESSPAELERLQQVVAEIVARDIERLCKRSSRRVVGMI